MTNTTTETRRVSPEGRGVWQAICGCGWKGQLYGPDAITRRAGAFHTPDEQTHSHLTPGTIVDILPESNGENFGNPKGWTVVGPTRHPYAMVVREPVYGTTVHVMVERLVVTHVHSLTCHTHEFLISGCRNQWVHDHDSADCWRAFLAHNDAPADLNVDGFYRWKYPND